MNYDPVDQFLAALGKSGLLSASSLPSLSQELKTMGPGSQEEVAARLVDRNILTPFQAERILSGEADDCVLAGRYHLLEKIGAGGMGTVYRALDSQLKRTVAVKLMAAHHLSNPDAKERFEREARALAHLALPNIVQAFDSGDDKGRPFLVMEFVKGVGLDKLLRDQGKLPATVAADYIYQTALGMQPVHDRGMIHRDLKPSNLLLTSEGAIKILDLGLARFFQDQIPDSGLTRENTALGTPDFMAPEQFRDARAVDPRADVYALGCTLYTLIGGLVPFPGSSLSDKAQAHESREPPPLEERAPHIPAGLALTVARMMAKRPADRFASMRAVAEALAPYVAGSSPSLPSIRKTISWQGDLLLGQRPRLSRTKLVGVGAALVAATAAFVLLVSGFWRKPDGAADKLAARDDGKMGHTAGDKKPEPLNVQEPKKPDDIVPQVKNEVLPEPKALPDPPKVVAIPNGLTVAQDGAGQFKTIAAALDEAQPGMTIQILDDAVYKEQLHIADADRQKNITLAAPKGAALELSVANKFALKIDGVPGVKVVGLHFRSKDHPHDIFKGPPIFFVVVTAQSAGVALENLTFQTLDKIGAVVIYNAPLARSDPPIVVRRCQVQVGGYGMYVSGSTTVAAANVMIVDNTVNAMKGISLEMYLSDILVAGNVVRNGDMSNMEFMNLLPKTSSVVVANNTLHGGSSSVRFWDTAPFAKTPMQALDFRNNVLFGAQLMDMYYVKVVSGQKVDTGMDSRFLLDHCRFENNRRDLAGGTIRNITPLAPKDREVARSDFISLGMSNKDFLRPRSSSSLASEGAGQEDPAFPTYIGAIPPEGTEPWDWNTTWRMLRK